MRQRQLVEKSLFAALSLMLILLSGANAQLTTTESTNTFLLPASIMELEQQMRDARANRQSCKPQPPFEVRLDVAHPPQRGIPAQIIFSVLPIEYLHNAEVEWDVAEGVTVLQAPRRMVGIQLDTKGVTQFPLTVQFNQFGEFEVAASIIERGEGFQFGRRLHLYFNVTPQGITVSNLPTFTPVTGMVSPLRVGAREVITTPEPDSVGRQGTPPVPDEVQPRSDDFSPQGPDGTARIIGHFYYRHRDNTLHGAYGAQAQVWDRDTFSGDDLLANPIVNWDGSFDTGDFDNGSDGDPFDGSRQDVYVRWLTLNGRVNVVHYDSGSNFPVGDVNVGNNISDGLHDIGGWFIDTDGPGTYPDDGVEAAYEICDAISRAWAFYYYGLGYDIASCNARWKEGGSDGAYYNGGGTNRISLTDGDQQDNSVIFHEYGHHVMNIVKGGFPAGSGGAHSWFGCYNGGLAWSEGWATYSGQSSLASDTYCDTPGVGDSANFCVNVENTTGNCLDLSVGTTGEASVASSLFDVYDSRNAPNGDVHDDRLYLGATAIWDTFVNGGVLNNMLNFVNAWFARGHDYDSSFRDIMRSHRILPAIDDFVTVELDHTYRGDLIVEVGVGNPNAPLYRKVVSNREGGSADNLYAQVSVSDAPAFYLTPSSSVVWYCKVYDAAGADSGTLHRFSLTHGGVTYVSGNVPQSITDFNFTYAYIPTQSSRFALIDIAHTYRGDLVVELGVGDPNSPLYSTVVSNRAGGSLDNMWCQVDLSSLSAYLPPTQSRRWWVRVADRAGADVGSINGFWIYNNGTWYTSTETPAPIQDFQTTIVYIPHVDETDGDVNGDGCVDDADLAAVVFEFGGNESGAFGNTDLNDDGIVDDADLAEVIFNFGNGC